MNLGILEGLQAHGTNCDTTCMEMLPGNHKRRVASDSFCSHPSTPFLLSSLYIDLSFSISLFSFYSLLPSSSRFFFKPFEQVHCSLLARNLLFPEPSTELKRVTLSRQARAMHNRPFSWSRPRHYCIDIADCDSPCSYGVFLQFNVKAAALHLF